MKFSQFASYMGTIILVTTKHFKTFLNDVIIQYSKLQNLKILYQNIVVL